MPEKKRIRSPAKILVGLRFKKQILKTNLIKAKKLKLMELKKKKGLL